MQGCNLPFVRLPTSLRLKDELHMLDPVGLKEDHDDERPQPQDEAARRVPIFRLWFLQNKDNRASLTRDEGFSNEKSKCRRERGSCSGVCNAVREWFGQN